MKKTVVALALLMLTISACMIFVIRKDVHLPKFSSVQEEMRDGGKEEQTSAIGDGKTSDSVGELIRQGGTEAQVIDVGQYTLQVNGWQLVYHRRISGSRGRVLR